MTREFEPSSFDVQSAENRASCFLDIYIPTLRATETEDHGASAKHGAKLVAKMYAKAKLEVIKNRVYSSDYIEAYATKRAEIFGLNYAKTHRKMYKEFNDETCAEAYAEIYAEECDEAWGEPYARAYAKDYAETHNEDHAEASAEEYANVFAGYYAEIRTKRAKEEHRFSSMSDTNIAKRTTQSTISSYIEAMISAYSTGNDNAVDRVARQLTE